MKQGNLADHAAKLVLDVDADDLVERSLCHKSKLARAGRIESMGPAVDDANHQRIGLAANAGRDLVAGDSPQGRNLLLDGARHARHGEVDARAELFARKPGRMD